MNCSALVYESIINSDDNFKLLKNTFAQFTIALEQGRAALDEAQAEEVKQALEQVKTLAGELRSCGVNSPLFVDFAQELIALLGGRKPIEEAEEFAREASAFLESSPPE